MTGSHSRAAVVGALGALLAAVAVTPVATHAATAPKGAPSPDGRILFVDFRAGVIDTVNPDGSVLQQVTDPATDGVVNGEASWTPDGARIVYTASRNDGDFTVYSIGANGTGRRQEVPNRGGFFDFDPVVTPDGRSVLFDRCRPDPVGGCGLFSAHLTGRPRIRAVVGYPPRGQDEFTALFAVSPNGKRLAFTRGNFRGIINQVWVSRIDGAQAHPVTKPAQELTVSDWTPDGHLVVSGPNAHFGSQLFLMPASGGTPTLVASGPFPHADFFGDASPSGDRIVFLGDEDFPDLSGNHLYIVGSDGTGRVQVDVGTDSVGVPAWGTAPVLAQRSTRAPWSPSMSDRQRRALSTRIPSYLPRAVAVR